MAKERATDKPNHNEPKEKKLSAADKVKKNSKYKKEKEKRHAKKVFQIEKELDINSKVEEQAKSEDELEAKDEAVIESPVSEAKEDAPDALDYISLGESDSEGEDDKKSKKSDKKQPNKWQLKNKAEKSKQSPKKSSGEAVDGAAAADESGQNTANPGLNREGRRRLILIDRQRIKIQQRMGIELGSTDRKEEVDKALEEWIKFYDERAAKRVAKKAQQAERMKRKHVGRKSAKLEKAEKKAKGAKKKTKGPKKSAPAPTA